MKDVLVTFVSRLQSIDAVKALGIICATGLGALGISCLGGYDLDLGATGISFRKRA